MMMMSIHFLLPSSIVIFVSHHFSRVPSSKEEYPFSGVDDDDDDDHHHPRIDVQLEPVEGHPYE